jgi:hypothetical protein
MLSSQAFVVNFALLSFKLTPMKIFSPLPERKHYAPIDSTKEGRWLFQDKGTPCLRIVSPVPNPWGYEKWVIMLSFQQNKADKSSSVNRLDLKLFEFDENNRDNIIDSPLIREIYKGKFGYTNALSPIVFTAFFQAIKNGEVQQNIWVNYTVMQINH